MATMSEGRPEPAIPQITFRVSRSTYKRVRELARADRRSVADWLRLLLERNIGEGGGTGEQNQQQDRRTAPVDEPDELPAGQFKET